MTLMWKNMVIKVSLFWVQ